MARRADVTERLRRIAATDEAGELIAALDDPSPEVARCAIRRLTGIEGHRAADALRARLLSADLSLSAEIAIALRRIGDECAVDIAIAGLRDRLYTRRLAAARALGGLRELRAVNPLRAALADEIAGVRMAVLGALGEIGPGAGADAGDDCARLLSDRDPHVRIAAVRAIARLGLAAGTRFVSAVCDADPMVRLEVARHLSGLPENAARTLLADPDVRVREAAAHAAGKEHLDELAHLLIQDPSSDVRHAAAITLGDLDDRRALDALLAAVEDQDAIVRMAALRALVQLLTEAGAAGRLCRELRSVRPERRRAAVYALAHLHVLAAAGDVSRLVDDPDHDVRRAVLQTVDELMRDPVAVVRHLTSDNDPEIRNAAEIWLLRRMRRAT